MNKQYQDLFQMVARNGALSAETAMAALKDAENKEKEIGTLVDMRNRFNALEDKILKNEKPLTLPDFILLYAGAKVTRNTVEKNINTWTAVIKEYDDNLIPKLYEVGKEMNDEKRAALVDEYFN